MPERIKLTRSPVELVLAPLEVATTRYSLGSAGPALDLETGYQRDVWFVGGANGIGRLDVNGAVTLFPRTVGSPPTRIVWGRRTGPPYGEGHRYIDPQGGRIGLVANDGSLDAELELDSGLHPTSVGQVFASGRPSGGLIGTREGVIVDLYKNRRFKAADQPIDSLSWDELGEMIWFACGGSLNVLYEITGAVRTLPLPGASIRGLAANNGSKLIYVDAGRNTVGCIHSDTHVEEFVLPDGVSPRAVDYWGTWKVWFTGRGGTSLFKLDYFRTLYEYKCADQSSDLAAIRLGNEDAWFTEPRHDALTHARMTGF